MSKHANPTLIGGFVVGAVALAILGILVFGGGKFFAEKHTFVLYFQGSVKGLRVGATVDFRGVRVGTVTDISVFFDTKEQTFRIPVLVDLETQRITRVSHDAKADKALEELSTNEKVEMLIKQGLKAQLQLESFVTGQLFVQLDIYPAIPPRLVAEKSPYVEIPTIPSNIEKLTTTMEQLPLDEIVNKLLSALEGISRMVNSPEVTESVQALHGTLKDIQVLVRKINGQVDPLATDLDDALKEVKALAQNANRQITSLSSDLGDTLKSTQKLIKSADGQVKTLTAGLGKTSETARDALQKVEKTFAGLESMTGNHSSIRYELNNALRELSAAARSLRVVADYLQRHPEALLRGKP